MSKSILVIDTPECCDYCPIGRIFGMSGQVECMVSKSIRVNNNGRIIPDWCPLHEIPQKYETVSMDYERGYNACIEDIFRENV